MTTTTRRASARDVALAMLDKMGPISLVRLHAMVFYANAISMVEFGAPLCDEPAYAGPRGPVYRSITGDWLRRVRMSMRRLPRRLVSLRRRVRRWAIQEAGRRGPAGRVHRLNIPGGWSDIDAHAQRAGLEAAWGLRETWA